MRTLTLAPPLARRVGGLYAPLARLRPLRSHRLALARRRGNRTTLAAEARGAGKPLV